MRQAPEAVRGTIDDPSVSLQPETCVAVQHFCSLCSSFKGSVALATMLTGKPFRPAAIPARGPVIATAERSRAAHAERGHGVALNGMRKSAEILYS